MRRVASDHAPMPSIRRVLETSLYCDDLAATARFYEDILGMTVHFSDARLVALDASGSVLLLFARGASRLGVTFADGTIPGHDGHGPAHLAFAVDADELDAWVTRLTKAGVAVESRITWARGGRSLYFRDPEGHSVELATPGVWPTY
jgi:catechol 2,3-dioxygenase-like lactoylglutathione lyase family enzyme